MDADAADRPPAGPADRPWADEAADGPRVGVDRAAGDRLRAGVLFGSALVALVAGGLWWQTSAPVTGPLPAATPSPQSETRFRSVPEGSEDGVIFRVDPETGAAFRVDVDRGGADPRRLMEQMLDEEASSGRLDSFPDTVWTQRADLAPERGVVRQAAAEAGARHLLQYRCTGPGELLVVIDGARAADPFTSACDGSVTSTEVTAAGGSFQVALSTANAGPLRVEAQLVALP
ncbi:hypothetical protein NCC78_27830 [Micromonospora phytophila]|uniref:hypothetical protein n=1 Tax=Micromonospora phytophila TaxID=709888 RepID=UPI00202F7D95|nr:hypothetical protein [Micromonospora phytophila]MCM0678456.1 hypothetical protein [Micromonospora phytophila]